MRCAVHTDALKAAIEGRGHPLTGPVLMAGKIGITQHILEEYSRELGSNVYFQAWFAAAQSHNRLVIKHPQEASSKLSGLNNASLHYGVASYFSAGRLYSTKNTGGLNIQALQNLGLQIFDVEDAPANNISGDNPVLTISLAANGNKPPSILDNFLLAEEEIIIYDKYINDDGLHFISHVAAQLSPGSTLHIRTSNLSRTCKQPAQIHAALMAVNPTLIISCKVVSTCFRQQAHDRYVFFGKRLQAVFTAGVGCFGSIDAAGRWQNKQSKINVYALESGTLLEIEADDGTLLTTPYVEELHA